MSRIETSVVELDDTNQYEIVVSVFNPSARLLEQLDKSNYGLKNDFTDTDNPRFEYSFYLDK